MTAPLQPGDPEALGPHRLVARLGQGAMGRVYLARSGAGLLLAVKAVHPRYAGDLRFRERFRREIAAARRVTGAFTAPILDADPDGSPPWLATAYVPGPSLRDAVARHGPLPEDALRVLGAGLGEALDAVHAAGLVHRDLKPSNVLLAADGPRLIDFGISRAVDDAALTAAGALIGTAGFMSPEQAGAEEAGPASDVFSLAATLVFAATGHGPFGVGPAEVLLYRTGHEAPDLDGVPGALHDVLTACLRRAPAERPAARHLPNLFLPEPAPTAPDGWLPGPVAADATARAELAAEITSGAEERRVLGRRRLLAALAAGGGTLVAAGGTMGLLRFTGRKAAPRELWRTTTPHTGAAFVGDLLVHDAGADLIAVDPRTGSRRWRTRLFPVPDELDAREPPRPGATFAAVDGALYAAGAEDGSLRRIDPATGQVTATLGPDMFLASGRLLGAQGSVVVGGGESGMLIRAVDVVRKKVLWTIDQRPQDTITVPPSGGLIYRTESTGIVHAYAAGTGRERWQADLGPGAVGALVRDGDTVYASGQGLHALDAATGLGRWTLPGSSGGSLAVHGDTVFTDAPQLRAIDKRTGTQRWRTDTPGIGGLAISGDLLLASWLGPEPASRDEGLLGWDRTSGRQRWRYPFPSQDVVPLTGPATHLVTSGDRFAASYNALLIAFRLP